MPFWSVMLLAVGLAMDAFAVSISCGITGNKNRMMTAVSCAAAFGLFQAGMALAGWLLADLFDHYIEAVDHWIAFGLLAFIGLKMIYEARRGEEPVTLESMKMLLALSVATSIDAMAAGIGLSAVRAPIAVPAAAIGVTTMVLSFLGVLFGARLGSCRYAKFFDAVGGIILIVLGVKILIEHMG